MTGEFFRELGVLVIVFYPLDIKWNHEPHGPLSAVIGGIFCLVTGIIIERRR
jgi:hypothetical protein